MLRFVYFSCQERSEQHCHSALGALGDRVDARTALRSTTSSRIMAVSAAMSLASTRHAPVGQRDLLSQQKVRGRLRIGAFGNGEVWGWMVMMPKCAPALAVKSLVGRNTSRLPGTRPEMRWPNENGIENQCPPRRSHTPRIASLCSVSRRCGLCRG